VKKNNIAISLSVCEEEYLENAYDVHVFCIVCHIDYCRSKMDWSTLFQHALASIPLLLVASLFIFLLNMKKMKTSTRVPRQINEAGNMDPAFNAQDTRKVGTKKLESIKRKQEKKQNYVVCFFLMFF
jgi:hypothetical protein